MERTLASITKARTPTVSQQLTEFQVELFRKTIHLLIAFVPSFAAFDPTLTLSVLAAGTMFYSYAELLRLTGRPVFLVSPVTAIASREGDKGHFVLGPVTLGLGAMIALMLYPEPAAAIAIYALAFGDGLSSLVGKAFGRVRMPLTGGKTVVGSATCFAAVFVVALAFTDDVLSSAIIAGAATILEVLPTGDLDNILVPVGTGFVASQLLALS